MTALKRLPFVAEKPLPGAVAAKLMTLGPTPGLKDIFIVMHARHDVPIYIYYGPLISPIVKSWRRGVSILFAKTNTLC